MKFKKLAAITGIVFSCAISTFFVYCKGGTNIIRNYTEQRKEATALVAYTTALTNTIDQYEASLPGLLALNSISLLGLRDLLLMSYETYVNYYSTQAIIEILTLSSIGSYNTAIESCGNAYLLQDIYQLPSYIQTAYTNCGAPAGTYLSFDFSYPNAPFIFYSDSNYTTVVCQTTVAVPTPSECSNLQNTLSSQIAALQQYGLH